MQNAHIYFTVEFYSHKTSVKILFLRVKPGIHYKANVLFHGGTKSNVCLNTQTGYINLCLTF